MKKQVTVSIVSHQHCSMLENLLLQMCNFESSVAHIIITHNVPTDLVIDPDRFPFQITVIENKLALGFGANHNQAFQHCLTEYFCILNPDVDFLVDPFRDIDLSIIISISFLERSLKFKKFLFMYLLKKG